MATAHRSDPTQTEPAGPYSAPHCVVRGSARGSFFHPDDYSLWRVLGELETGAELEWGTEHGDEVLFVLSGALEADGVRIPENSSFVIEAGAPAAVRSLGPTRLVHFGPIETASPADGVLGAPAEEGRGVHVITEQDASFIDFSGEFPMTGTFYHDGTCPTCRVTFFLIDGSAHSDPYVGASHLHSADEIIHVLEGELRVGPLSVPAGAAIAVPGDLRYSFRTPGPFRFLNYRADVSISVGKPGSEPVLETVANLTQRAVGVPD